VEEVLPSVWRAPAAQGVEVTVASIVALAQRSASYVRDVRAEVRKVTWPTWADLRRTTIVVVIFVVIIGLIIGLMDVIASKLLIDVLGRLFS
jgi:preprotein translocase subunit SecE